MIRQTLSIGIVFVMSSILSFNVSCVGLLFFSYLFVRVSGFVFCVCVFVSLSIGF